MRWNLKVAAQAACAVAAMVAVAACSSSSKNTSTPPTSTAGSPSGTAAAAAHSTGSPIKVGIICSCTGALASEGATAPDVYKAFVNTVNASGGINSHPLQVFLEDDASNPANSEADVQTLVKSDHVIALVDLTNLDETWANYIKSVNIPVIGSTTSTTPMYTNSDFYPEGQTEDALFPSIIDAGKTGGATNLGLLYCAEAVQCEEGIAPLKQTGQQLGLPVTYAGEIAATAPNYTAQCVAAQQAKITGLFVADVAQVANRVATDCTQQGYHPTYVIDGESLQPAITSTPGIKDNLVAPVPNLPYFADTPAAQAMNAALDKYYPGVRTNATTWTEYESEAWPSGLLLEDAAKAGNVGANGTAPTAAQLITGLESLKGDTLDGWAPPLTFAAGQPHPVHCWFTANAKNGQFGLPLGTKTTCENS